MSDFMSEIFSAFGSWRVGGVSIMVWIVGFLLISIISIFVKGNR